MKIAKRIFLILLILLAGIVLELFIYDKYYYSFEEMTAILFPIEQIDNYTLELIHNDFKTTEYYKNKKSHSIQFGTNKKIISESFTDYIKCNSILLDTFSKEYFNIDFFPDILQKVYFYIKDTSTEYYFLGNEKVNGINCLNFSLLVHSKKFDDKFEVYINKENNKIIRIDTFIKNVDKNDNEFTKVYTYYIYYNTVKNTDIVEFDKNNYLDYEFVTY